MFAVETSPCERSSFWHHFLSSFLASQYGASPVVWTTRNNCPVAICRKVATGMPLSDIRGGSVRQSRSVVKPDVFRSHHETNRQTPPTIKPKQSKQLITTGGTGNYCNEDSQWSKLDPKSGYQVHEIMTVVQEKPMTPPEKAGPTRYSSFCPNLSLCKLSA